MSGRFNPIKLIRRRRSQMGSRSHSADQSTVRDHDDESIPPRPRIRTRPAKKTSTNQGPPSTDSLRSQVMATLRRKKSRSLSIENDQKCLTLPAKTKVKKENDDEEEEEEKIPAPLAQNDLFDVTDISDAETDHSGLRRKDIRSDNNNNNTGFLNTFTDSSIVLQSVTNNKTYDTEEDQVENERRSSDALTDEEDVTQIEDDPPYYELSCDTAVTVEYETDYPVIEASSSLDEQDENEEQKSLDYSSSTLSDHEIELDPSNDQLEEEAEINYSEQQNNSEISQIDAAESNTNDYSSVKPVPSFQLDTNFAQDPDETNQNKFYRWQDSGAYLSTPSIIVTSASVESLNKIPPEVRPTRPVKPPSADVPKRPAAPPPKPLPPKPVKPNIVPEKESTKTSSKDKIFGIIDIGPLPSDPDPNFKFRTHFQKSVLPNPKKALKRIIKGETKAERLKRKEQAELDRLLKSESATSTPQPQSTTQDWKAFEELTARIQSVVQETTDKIKVIAPQIVPAVSNLNANSSEPEFPGTEDNWADFSKGFTEQTDDILVDLSTEENKNSTFVPDWEGAFSESTTTDNSAKPDSNQHVSETNFEPDWEGAFSKTTTADNSVKSDLGQPKKESNFEPDWGGAFSESNTNSPPRQSAESNFEPEWEAAFSKTATDNSVKSNSAERLEEPNFEPDWEGAFSKPTANDSVKSDSNIPSAVSDFEPDWTEAFSKQTNEPENPNSSEVPFEPNFDSAYSEQPEHNSETPNSNPNSSEFPFEPNFDSAYSEQTEHNSERPHSNPNSSEVPFEPNFDSAYSEQTEHNSRRPNLNPNSSQVPFEPNFDSAYFEQPEHNSETPNLNPNSSEVPFEPNFDSAYSEQTEHNSRRPNLNPNSSEVPFEPSFDSAYSDQPEHNSERPHSNPNSSEVPFEPNFDSAYSEQTEHNSRRPNLNPNSSEVPFEPNFDSAYSEQPEHNSERPNLNPNSFELPFEPSFESTHLETVNHSRASFDINSNYIASGSISTNKIKSIYELMMDEPNSELSDTHLPLSSDNNNNISQCQDDSSLTASRESETMHQTGFSVEPNQPFYPEKSSSASVVGTSIADKYNSDENEQVHSTDQAEIQTEQTTTSHSDSESTTDQQQQRSDSIESIQYRYHEKVDDETNAQNEVNFDESVNEELSNTNNEVFDPDENPFSKNQFSEMPVFDAEFNKGYKFQPKYSTEELKSAVRPRIRSIKQETLSGNNPFRNISTDSTQQNKSQSDESINDNPDTTEVATVINPATTPDTNDAEVVNLSEPQENVSIETSAKTDLESFKPELEYKSQNETEYRTEFDPLQTIYPESDNLSLSSVDNESENVRSTPKIKIHVHKERNTDKSKQHDKEASDGTVFAIKAPPESRMEDIEENEKDQEANDEKEELNLLTSETVPVGWVNFCSDFTDLKEETDDVENNTVVTNDMDYVWPTDETEKLKQQLVRTEPEPPRPETPDPDLEIPFHPIVDKDVTWRLWLRYPEKKTRVKQMSKYTTDRYWKAVAVRFFEERGRKVIGLHEIDENTDTIAEEPYRTLRIEPYMQLSREKLQQYDKYGKLHVFKLNHVTYKELVGIRPEKFSIKKIQNLVTHKPKQNITLDHLPVYTEVLKFGSLEQSRIRQLLPVFEDALMEIASHKDTTLNYSREEVSCYAIDEYVGRMNSDVVILEQKARTRIFCTAFVNGGPYIVLGLNDKWRYGREVVRRCDILPVMHDEWISIRKPHFHSCIEMDEYEKDHMLKFYPLDGCRFELMRFRVSLKENRELPLRARINYSIDGRRVTMRCELLVPGFFSATGRSESVPCEDIEIHIPVPEEWIYHFRVEKHHKYGSVHSTLRKPGKIKGLERITQMAQSLLPPSLLETSAGLAKYEHLYKSVVWRIPRIPEKNEATLRPHLLTCKLVLAEHDSVPEWDNLVRTSQIEFTMPSSTVSGVTVRSISVEHTGNVEKFVKYTSKYKYTIDIDYQLGSRKEPILKGILEADNISSDNVDHALSKSIISDDEAKKESASSLNEQIDNTSTSTASPTNTETHFGDLLGLGDEL